MQVLNRAWHNSIERHAQAVKTSCSIEAIQAKRLFARCIQQRAGFTTRSRPRNAGCAVTCSMKMSAATQQAPKAAPLSSKPGVTYTTYECNAFSLHFHKSGANILVDPWLVGELSFFGQPWLYRGTKRQVQQLDVDKIAAETDVVVLTQWVDDHTHMPTLERLPRSLPIVAAPEAATKIAPLNYENVTVLNHGEEVELLGGKLRVKATVGALVGPPWSQRQNGVVFTESVPDGIRLYYEPHCDYVPSSVQSVAPVDVVISPIVSQLLSVKVAAYELVKGDSCIVELLRMLQPKLLVPLENAAFNQAGPLAPWIDTRGEPDKIDRKLREAGVTPAVRFPAPAGQPLVLEL